MARLRVRTIPGRDGARRIDDVKVYLRRDDPSVSSQLVQHSIKKDSAKCGRWDASFRLLETLSPTVRKACKSVDFELISNEQK